MPVAKPALGQRVYVGGATGKIIKITEDMVLVEGVYFYPGGVEEKVRGETWLFEYDRSAFDTAPYDYEVNEWIMEDVPHA